MACAPNKNGIPCMYHKIAMVPVAVTSSLGVRRTIPWTVATIVQKFSHALAPRTRLSMSSRHMIGT